jgi:DNA gyrase subunit A
VLELSGAIKGGREERILLHEEVEKRYLAYALSTIVSRALPDVRDGLKPVHRRILYAMRSMGLSEAAKMRKSAAVVGEVIGKYHPHGDQAAYDALVRMAQDFSLRYPLVEGQGNFGSVDGDAPAAMRYTETRLSAFAAALMKEIDQGAANFRPTYDGMGEEPDVLPAAVPNLLLNGSSGIAVGMSCSFPPHNLVELLAACRAMIHNRSAGVKDLMKYVKGPDFPTGGEIVGRPADLEETYSTGHGAIKVRGTYVVEEQKRGRVNVVVTSIPYSVNKSRLIERIAGLIKDKRLRQVQDVRDESAADVRIVIELRSGDVKPEAVMGFLYRHTDLQINFPVNMIAITPQGAPERLSLPAIINYFLDFRYEKTILRLQYRLDFLKKRIHILVGFQILFSDLDKALKLIRSARSRQEAENALTAAFKLDKAQVDAILEMRLYRLVAIEIGSLMDELEAKKKEAADISDDLGSPERLWKIVDADLGEMDKKFKDPRRTTLVHEDDAAAVEFDPDELVEHEDATVILSKQGWIRRMKMEVADPSSLKFREGDGLLSRARVSTGRTAALFSNLGKAYVVRVIDIPATAGFGEPVGSLLTLADGEFMVEMLVAEPSPNGRVVDSHCAAAEPACDEDAQEDDTPQMGLFDDLDETPTEAAPPLASPAPWRGVLVTRKGKGFRFDYDAIRESTKRTGKRMVNLTGGDEVVAVKPEWGDLVLLATDSGRVILFPTEQAPVLAGAAQGVRMIGLAGDDGVVSLEIVAPQDVVRIVSKKGKETILTVNEIPLANRAGRGKNLAEGIARVEPVEGAEGSGDE